MTGQENREDQRLKDCLQDAFGYSDEQIQREMEEAEKALQDMEFADAADRIYKRIREGTAAEAGTQKEPVKAEGTKKVVRFRKKKVFLAVALVAVFMGALGFSAIGGKNYFLRETVREGGIVVFDNDKTKQDVSKLEVAYEEIQNTLEIQVLEMNFLPKGMKFIGLNLEKTKAIIEFDYKDNSFYFVQKEKEKEATFGIGSNRELNKTVHNKWLDKDIAYGENALDNGQIEYESNLAIGNSAYYIFGIMEEDNFIKIIENINLYK